MTMSTSVTTKNPTEGIRINEMYCPIGICICR